MIDPQRPTAVPWPTHPDPYVPYLDLQWAWSVAYQGTTTGDLIIALVNECRLLRKRVSGIAQVAIEQSNALQPAQRPTAEDIERCEELLRRLTRSAALGAMMNGRPLPESAQALVSFAQLIKWAKAG